MLRRIFIWPIRLYQLLLSPWLGPVCRYQPSCSEYMAQAIGHHGVWRGGLLGARRLCRCHPWGGHGYDPVPGELIQKL
jgi:putative membrane protein insertion efficiency factor